MWILYYFQGGGDGGSIPDPEIITRVLVRTMLVEA